ncbi:MAG: BREX-1 system phosphatase PglZ type A [Gallionella sp.]|jgi:uncharacterized protein (TIGR02687 family)
MENRIAQALTKKFDKHRIVFWYDTKQELRADFEALALAGVEKIELANNELGIKHRILRDQPDSKFLLFKSGPQPDDLNNWLLDVQLAHGEFRTDQVALWLAELELGLEFVDVVQAHVEFFNSAKRIASLKTQLKKDDTQGLLRLKMLAVCANSDERLDAVLEHLLLELAEGREDKFKLISRCGLDKVLWESLKRAYGYESVTPGLRDFVVELFKSCFAMSTQGTVKLSNDALVFLKRWKDSRQFQSSFEALSAECADILGLEQELGKRDFRKLIDVDYFKMIDQKIIVELVQHVSSRTVSAGEVVLWVRQRRQGHWYGEFAHLYGAIDVAAEFIRALDEATLTMESLADGIQRYSQSWFRLDQLYRKFIYHISSAGQASLMNGLTEQIENLYTNNYLSKLNNHWQPLVDACKHWDAPPIPLQRDFFNKWVKPFLEKDNKVYVIISDAFRYEIGEELLTLIRQEDRFEASIEAAMSMLPSYTQLGMAALLPNKALTLTGDSAASTLVDEQSSQGTPNREKILNLGSGKTGAALKADDFIKMDKDECRTLLRNNDVVYIYHNLIDFTGKRDSEERVFEAAEKTLEVLIRLIKKLTGANASNLLVTADHGFIYQHRPIAESDYLSADVSGDEILYRDRRFVMGRGLRENSSLKSFTSEQLGLTGNIEVQIPKSINRLRLQGSASRFVHGGATLQELVIPVIKINKKRQSDLSVVEVDILRGANATITSGQLAVVLYQAQAATEKIQGRVLRAGIYTQAGDLISDSHELRFDLTSENPRDREMQIRFVLSRKADDCNGQEVILRVDEKLAGTSHYKEYKSLRYMVRRSFVSDFDF